MSENGDDSTGENEVLDLFNEPEDYYEPEKQPTLVQHRMQDGRELQLRLVGHNPLWGHHLWQGGIVVSNYLESHASTLIQGRNVLELGAGAGLPSLVCALKGASNVVMTDYPDEELITNLQHNLDTCIIAAQRPAGKINAEGYLWGADVSKLLTYISASSADRSPNRNENQRTRFDVVILADLLFNHSEHTKLLETVRRTLKRSRDAQALVFFTPYRPWLLEKDRNFFELAGGRNWESAQSDVSDEEKAPEFTVEKILEHVMDRAMFENDPGDEMLRRTVFGYAIRWKLT